MTHLTFSTCAGDVIYAARSPLNDHQIDRLRQILSDEISAASTVGATKHANAALRLLNELIIAYTTAARWRACGGPTYEGARQ